MLATASAPRDRAAIGAVGVALAAILTGCNGPASSQADRPIAIDGSSTVYPLTQRIVEDFNASADTQVEVSLEFSGTGGGFDKFCAGETDINDASRPISTEEMAACKEGNIPYIELPVAYDALTVVVHPENNWLQSITTAELKQIWEPAAEGKLTRWNQVRPEWPDRPIVLYGPGTDSGTFDYFTEAIVGEAGASRTDYTDSEDDEVLARGIADNPDALGYFGFAYYQENQDDLKAVAIDSGNGAIAPARETVEDGSYSPLSRPLFVYVNGEAAQQNPLMERFVEFYLDRAPEAAVAVGYVPLPEEGYHIASVTFFQHEVGTVFDGQAQIGKTIGELLRQKAEY